MEIVNTFTITVITNTEEKNVAIQDRITKGDRCAKSLNNLLRSNNVSRKAVYTKQVLTKKKKSRLKHGEGRF